MVTLNRSVTYTYVSIRRDWYDGGMTTMIGVRELQRDASRIVRAVDAGDETFRVSIQGHPTDVVVTRETRPSRRGATLANVLASELYSAKPPEVLAEQLAMLEAGRDAVGVVGGVRE